MGEGAMLDGEILAMAAWVGAHSAEEPLSSEKVTRHSEEVSDRVLMGRVARGDRESFAALYHRYERPLFGFLYRMSSARPLAEDLLQETFTRVWLAAGTFDPGRGTVRGWLYTVALNTARTELGKKRHRVTHVPLEDEVEPHADVEWSLAESLDHATRAATVSRAVAELPDFMREVVVLRCYQQLSFDEIAQVTGAPLGTLKSRFHRAVAALRAALGTAAEGGDA